MITRGCEPDLGEILFDVENYFGIHKSVVGIAEKATMEDVDKIAIFEDNILKALPDAKLFQGHDAPALKEDIEAGDYVVVIREQKKKTLMALLIFVRPRDCEHNLALDAKLDKSAILKTAVIPVIAVHPDYRGIGIQRYLLKLAEKFAKDCGAKYLTATVSPQNPHSLQNFLDKGYEIRNEKIKYGGKNRYIMLKILN